MKRDTLDQLVRAARTDAPSPALLEELKTLVLLGKAAPDAALGLTATKTSLGVAASGSGKAGAGALGAGAAFKAGVGLASLVLVAATGLVFGLPVLEGEKGTAPDPSKLGATGMGRDADIGLAPPVPEAREVDARDVEDRDEGQEQSTLPLPPVFDSTVHDAGSARPSPGSVTRTKGSLNHGAESRSQRFLAEAKLVDEARRALRTNAQEAFQLAEECARKFPNGAAATERNVISIEALVRLGREEEALARMSSFEQAHPNSFHLPYLRRLLVEDAKNR